MATTSAMQVYRRRALWVPLGILGYAATAILATPASNVELFPFFNWSLFSITRSPAHMPVLRVTAVNGVELDEPKLFYDLDATFAAARARDPLVVKATDRLGWALREGDADLAASSRATIENVHMRDAQSVDYEVVQLTFDPIERYETGAVIDEEVLGRFSKE